MPAAGFITIPEWWLWVLGGVAMIFGFLAVMLFMTIWSNPLVKMLLKAKKMGHRLAMVHYPSGQVKLSIPKLLDDGGNSSPYWEVEGVPRFKDSTGEKWESFEDIKILHYLARSPVPISTNQAAGLDQLNDMLSWSGFATKGYLKEVYWMIAQAAKGPEAEAEAWKLLNVTDEDTLQKIKKIVDYIIDNPEIRYTMFRTGAYTYQTAVSVLDQLIGTTVANTSDMISFVEDRTRRKLADRTSELMKWVMIMVPIIFAIGIAGAAILIVLQQGAPSIPGV
jgi:hypothetical protein